MIALPSGAALKNRATLPESCEFAIECALGEEYLGPSLVDAFIERLGEMRPGAAVFVRSTLLAPFFDRAFHLIRQPFVLVTGGCDAPSPGAHRDALEDPRLLRWFGEDSDLPSPHAKFEPMPLGIADPNLPMGNQEVMLKLHARMPAVEDKPLLASSSFHLTLSHPARRGVYAAIRDIEGIVFQRQRVAPELLWIRHAGHAFVISPRGNGLDCHRTWEALLLRSIPIVRRSALDELHGNFPIAIVDDWRDISLSAMRSWRDELKDRFTLDMFQRLTRDYWMNRIRSAARR